MGDIVNTVFIGKESTHFRPGMAYLLFYGKNCFIRRLASINQVLGFTADNPDFPELRIGLDEIDELWEIKGVYSENLKKSNTVESRISELANAIEKLSARVKKLEEQG
jgi:hypothetical protein